MMGFGESNAGCNPSARQGITIPDQRAAEFPVNPNLKMRTGFAI